MNKMEEYGAFTCRKETNIPEQYITRVYARTIEYKYGSKLRHGWDPHETRMHSYFQLLETCWTFGYGLVFSFVDSKFSCFSCSGIIS